MDSQLLMYSFVALVTCLTPGAGVLYTVSNAFRYGKANAWRSPLGNTIGVTVMSVISATGLGALIAANTAVFSTLQVVGALVLAWFGWKSWKAPVIDLGALGKGMSRRDADVRSVIKSAALLQVTNPMLIVFLLSLMPPFIASDRPYGPQVAMLSGMFIVICLIVHLFYSYTACAFGRFLKGERFSWWLNRVSAVLFWICSAAVVASVLRG